MNFRIFLRCTSTGMESGFDDKQAVADFLATVDRQDYTGWQALGELPAVTGSSDEAPAAAVEANAISAEPAGEGAEPGAVEGVGQEDAAAVVDPDATLPGPATVEAVTNTPSDTYLPAEVAHEAPPAAEGQP